jgi:hypothetical protein
VVDTVRGRRSHPQGVFDCGVTGEFVAKAGGSVNDLLGDGGAELDLCGDEFATGQSCLPGGQAGQVRG